MKICQTFLIISQEVIGVFSVILHPLKYETATVKVALQVTTYTRQEHWRYHAHFNMEEGKFHPIPSLGKELPATKDSWEKN